MLQRMVTVAAESVRKPSVRSVWHPGVKRYLCPDDAGYEEAVAAQSVEIVKSHPEINPVFKLVFLTAAVGTLLFTVICVGVHVATGDRTMSPPLERTVTALLDMAKIGFGAVAGMLGAHTLKGTE